MAMWLMRGQRGRIQSLRRQESPSSPFIFLCTRIATTNSFLETMYSELRAGMKASDMSTANLPLNADPQPVQGRFSSDHQPQSFQRLPEPTFHAILIRPTDDRQSACFEWFEHRACKFSFAAIFFAISLRRLHVSQPAVD